VRDELLDPLMVALHLFREARAKGEPDYGDLLEAYEQLLLKTFHEVAEPKGLTLPNFRFLINQAYRERRPQLLKQFKNR
jgi:hypothetical protein